MVIIRRARSKDKMEIEKLISAYHSFEGLRPVRNRIARAVDEQLQTNAPGLLLVAESKKKLVGVALGVFETSAELGRVMDLNDFYVVPSFRRKGVGTKLARRLLQTAKNLQVDEINLEVIAGNQVAESFWKSIGFALAKRSLFKHKLTRKSNLVD